MNIRNKNKLLGLALVGAYSLFGASGAFAAAGLSIGNTATLSYDVGGAGQTAIPASTNFLEDRLVNYTVARQTVGAVAPNSTDEAVGFTLTNSGNSTQDFLLRAEDSAAADPFAGTGTDNLYTATNFRAYVDDGDLAFTAADITADVRTVVDLAPLGAVTVWIVADMPATRTDLSALIHLDSSTVSLVAQVAIATTASGFVTPEAPGGELAGGTLTDAILTDHNGQASTGGSFQDAAGTLGAASGIVGTDQLDDTASVQTVFFNTTTGGQESDVSAYEMQVAALTVTKASVALWDPVNLAANPKSFPGAYVRYTITILNGPGAGDADLTTLSDALDAAIALDADYVTNVGPGNPTNGAGLAFEVTHVDNAVTNTCTGDVGDADVDDCAYTGGAGGTIAVDISALMTAVNAQLSATESLTISYNAIVQ